MIRCNTLPQVVPHDWKVNWWWALTGNRRLYLYKALEEVGAISTVPVLEYSLGTRIKRFTTDCEGAGIKVRGCGNYEV